MKYYFFHGKGGVGKTTTSSAFAVNLAKQGGKTLIVSTDPASNLSDVFEQNIGNVEKMIEGIDNLYAVEMDPEAEVLKYKKKVLGGSENLLPKEVLDTIEEEFKSPCTTEIAFFNSFTEFFLKKDYDSIIFDTAPSGHTLRLLELPLEWTAYIDEVKKGAGLTCMGPVVNIDGYYNQYKIALDALRNPELTAFVFVTHPKELDLFEIRNSIEEIKNFGITNIEIIINAVLPDELYNTGEFNGAISYQREILKKIDLLGFNTLKIGLKKNEVRGLKALINLFSNEVEKSDENDKNTVNLRGFINNIGIKQKNDELMKTITPQRTPFYFFFTGKGGTGKTTSSLLFGRYFANQGKKTLVVSADYSNHIAKIMGFDKINETPVKANGSDNLYLAGISPTAALDEYKESMIKYFKSYSNNEESLKVLKEELNSPCTEEVAIFKKFSGYFFGYKDFDVIVFDAAPTGHALRLLYISLEYAKMDKKDLHLEEFVKVLKDTDKTFFSLCLYPEYSPIEEAKRAYDDLKEAGINVSFLVINYLLSKGFENDFFKTRKKMQEYYLDSIRDKFSIPLFLIPQNTGEIDNQNALNLFYPKVF
ncbi:MAG: TRC40/GET3/ArsA family transport-energizing ATPase [bacterium]